MVKKRVSFLCGAIVFCWSVLPVYARSIESRASTSSRAAQKHSATLPGRSSGFSAASSRTQAPSSEQAAAQASAAEVLSAQPSVVQEEKKAPATTVPVTFDPTMQLHGAAVSSKIAAYVGSAEPEKVVLPDVRDTSAQTAKKIDAAKTSEADNAFDALVKEVKAEKRLKIAFKDIPLVNYIPLPKVVKSFLDGLALYLPVVAMTTKGWSIDGMIDIGKVRVWGRIIEEVESSGKKRHSVSVELPLGWKFSNLFPKTDKFDPGMLDLLSFERAYIVLSDAKYKDTMLKKDIRPGLNFLAQVRPVGEFFETFNKLSGGVLKSLASLDLQGTIGLNEQLIGSVLELELPVALKFTSWLETTKMNVFFALEERLIQVVRPVVGLSGGIQIILPFQKKPVEFRMTGKYAIPEDLELYGEMNGWLDNVPYPYMKIGDMRLGIVTDIAAAVATGGLLTISGINLAGGIGVMNSKLHFSFKGALDSTTGIDDMTIIAKGTVTLKDLVWFWLQYAEDVVKLFKKDESFAQNIVNKVPALELNNATITFVPKETIEEKKRIEVSVGSVNIFGAVGSGMLYIDKQGVRGKLKLPEIIIGNKQKPLFYITGAGENNVKGAVFDVALNPLEQSVMGDVEWGSALVGLKYIGRAKLTTSGVEVSSTFKWANLVDTQLTVNADLLAADAALKNFSAHMRLQQSGQEQLASILKKTATDLLTDLEKKLDTARDAGLSEVEGRWVSKSELLSSEIANLENKIKEKTKECDAKHTGIGIGLRPLCYVVKGIVADSLALIAKKLQKKVELNVRMVGGVAAIETATETAKAVGRPLGKVMNFLADVLTNVVVLRQFEAETSFAELSENKPTLLKILDVRIAGKDFLIKDLPFEVNKPEEFLMSLFDQFHKQSVGAQ